jgi:pilus assembly protein Flp/PilA
MAAIRRFLRSEDGATAVEYAVLLGLVLLACITAIMVVGQATAVSYEDSASSINTAVGAGS